MVYAVCCDGHFETFSYMNVTLCIPMQSVTFMSFETPTSVGNGYKTNSNKRVS